MAEPERSVRVSEFKVEPFPGSSSWGAVHSVKGSEAKVSLPSSRSHETARATVGAFLRIQAGDRRVIGIVTAVDAADGPGGTGAEACVDLMGEIICDPNGLDRFQRGVSIYPAIGDAVSVIGREELRLIYSGSGQGSIAIGALHNDSGIEARISIDNTLSKHFAVLGSTGVGKSSGVAVILREILEARPNLRIFLLDGHNEYGRCFGSRANVVNAHNLKLPFWLFNFEEFIDVIYGGRPGVEEELDILAEHIPIAKGMYLAHRSSSARRVDPRRAGYNVDTPVPYLLQDLIALIDERMGKLENRATRMHYHRLLGRIEVLRGDSRYGFMFENANVGGDTMSEILSHLFRIDTLNQPMTVLQVAGLPLEVVDAVVCVVTRLAFDFGLWSDGAMPMLFVCEEAHRFAPADSGVGFAPTRRALLRIAKEGRKYGVYLGLVTQRPAELDPTIISQCNTLFAMRMANDRDQALLRSAVTDSVANLLAFVPSLGTREVVAFGEGLPLPARLTFKALPADRLPRSETFERVSESEGPERSFVKLVVERWRGATAGSRAADEVPPAPGIMPIYPETETLLKPTSAPGTASSSSGSPVANRLDQIRAQILKRNGASAGQA